MRALSARDLLVVLALVVHAGGARAQAPEVVAAPPLAAEFVAEVDKRLEVPEPEQRRYAARLEASLAAAGEADLPPQYVLLVDRSPAIQALLVYWRAPDRAWRFVGAAPVSTGRPGSFDHFVTPLGVFAHTTANMDFRAEGTLNELGIRGYGARGMRVYDFGWVTAQRGWGGGGTSAMRLQMHATDPEVLEPRLGETRSKGCIRIPASLDRFIDHHGLLDQDYERALAEGQRLWVLASDRAATPWPGRYLVVIDSLTTSRPSWARWQRAAPRRPVRADNGPAGAAC